MKSHATTFSRQVSYGLLIANFAILLVLLQTRLTGWLTFVACVGTAVAIPLWGLTLFLRETDTSPPARPNALAAAIYLSAIATLVTVLNIALLFFHLYWGIGLVFTVATLAAAFIYNRLTAPAVNSESTPTA